MVHECNFHEVTNSFLVCTWLVFLDSVTYVMFGYAEYRVISKHTVSIKIRQDCNSPLKFDKTEICTNLLLIIRPDKNLSSKNPSKFSGVYSNFILSCTVLVYSYLQCMLPILP